MLGPITKGTTFWAQTCIEPDRIALLARDVSRLVRGGLRSGVIHFPGAPPGQLVFSIRRPMIGSELMSFRVDIARGDEGFTIVAVHIPEHRASTAAPQGFPA